MNFENEYIRLHCNLRPNGTLIIEGTLKGTLQEGLLYAANPIQRMTNYSGSALPYPSREMAFDRTPNRQYIDSQSFDAIFIYPNAYYFEDRLIPPTLYFKHQNHISEFSLPNPFPLKTLQFRDTIDSPLFFEKRRELGVQSQEKLIKKISEPYLY